MAHSPPPKLWYLPNHRDTLQTHTQLPHKVGNAKTEANYHAYNQTLIKDGTANRATSNAYLTSSNVPFKTKCIIMKYRTGTLYNQKHAVLFKLSTSQTCLYCEDTRPQNQLNAAKEQHRDLCNILQGASVTLHIILLGVGGTIYNTHTLKPFKELDLDSQRVKKLASKLHVHSVNFAAKLVRTRRALSSAVINSHQEPVSGQACNPLDTHLFFLSFRGGGALRCLVPKWLLFLN